MSDGSKAVFLSYASQDADAARRICEALRAAGVEVWFDQSELRGGDAWDAKIRKQIKECALFVPVISANTQARREGYFRLEWRVATERMRHMDDDLPFLVPVVIDETKDADAFVPERFREVQWTRLPGGVTPRTFCDRVVALLADEADPRPPRADKASPRANPSEFSSRRSWLAAGAIAAAIGLGLVLVRPWQAQRSETPTVTGGGGATKPISEARRLVQQARALREPWGLDTRDDFKAAELLLQRALELDRTDGEIWAAYAQLSCGFVHYGYDRSEARMAQARQQAEMSVKLAPDSAEARLAQAAWFYRSNRAEAEKLLPKLLEMLPNDRRALRLAGDAWRETQPERALEYLRRAAALPGGDPWAWWSQSMLFSFHQRYREMDAALDQCLAVAPIGRAFVAKAAWQMVGLGDPKAAMATLTAAPPAVLTDERGIFLGVMAARWNNDPARALQLVASYPEDWLEDNAYNGPKRFLSGLAQAQAGRTEAAKAEWTAALQVVEKRLAAAPSNPLLLGWQASLLALVGEKQRAETVLRIFLEAGGPEVGGASRGLALTYQILGRNADAIATLRRGLDTRGLIPLTHWFLRLDPMFAGLRDEPAFSALVQEAENRDRATGVRPSEPAQAGGQTVDSKSVAVLAFDNRSDDKEAEYFSDGISDELINALGRVPGLTVRGRTSAFFFKGRNVPVQEIAEKLGVTYLVRGSVRKAGSKVRITAQLSRAATDEIVWSSESLERELRDVFAVQDEIAALIARNLSAKLGGAKPATDAATERRVENVEAYEEVLKGRFHAEKWTASELNLAVSHYHQALAKQPNYALAYAGLAGAYGLIRYFHYADPASVTVLYQEAAAKAQQFDGSLPEVHHQLGDVACYVSRDFSAAEREYQHALQLNPVHVPTHMSYAFLLGALGRHADARMHAERVRELDPLSPNAAIILGWVRFWAGDVDGALQAGREAIALSPEFFNAYLLTAWALARQGRHGEALAQIELALRLSPPAEMLGDLAFLYGRAGRKDEARKLLEELLAKSQQTYVPAYTIYRAYDALGEIEAADRWMNKAIANNEGRIVYFKGGADEITRANPHYREWLRKIGLDP